MRCISAKIKLPIEYETEEDLSLGEIQRQRFEDEREQAFQTFKEQLKIKVNESLQGAAKISTKKLPEKDDLETSVMVETAFLDPRQSKKHSTTACL